MMMMVLMMRVVVVVMRVIAVRLVILRCAVNISVWSYVCIVSSNFC